MSKSWRGVCLTILLAASIPTNLLQAHDSLVSVSCQDRSACEESHCEEGCHLRKSLGIGMRIPSIRWGISLGCDGSAQCGHGCSRCGHCKKDCWWTRMEPPRGPLVFSVPAVTVPQQALAIQPQLAPLPLVPQAAPPCKPQDLSPTDKLLMEILLRQLETAGSQSQAQKTPATPSASSAGSDRAMEARLTDLENRLERILEILER